MFHTEWSKQNAAETMEKSQTVDGVTIRRMEDSALMSPMKPTSDCESESTNSGSQPTTPLQMKQKRHSTLHAKDRTTKHSRKLTYSGCMPNSASPPPVLNAISALIKRHSAAPSDYSSLSLQEKYSLLGQLKQDVTVMESTMQQAAAVLEQLLRLM